VFAGMTAQRPDDEVKRAAWTSAGEIAVTLLIVTWAGSGGMAFFGITIDSLRAAGGTIVLVIGPRRSGKRTHSCSRKRTLVTRTLV
jgi:multiple antibiotic resistance protein